VLAMNNRAATFLVFIFALTLAFGTCLLPQNDYQRWQLLDGTIYQTLRWAYERIHFDPTPIDVAIVGPSRSQLGVSSAEVERRMSQFGRPLRVANFSIIADGRNIEWAIVNEIYKCKSPRVIVVAVDETPYSYGHPAFKYVAPVSAIISPPVPLLHNYFYDLVYLPYRQLNLFGAWLFPVQFGLSKSFDPRAYARSETDFSVSHRLADGRWIEMDREIPRAILLQQAFTRISNPKRFVLPQPLGSMINGDDHAYIGEISKIAKAHGAQVIFLFMPTFNGPSHMDDEKYLLQFGRILDNGDLAQKDKLYEGWAHFNHAGALIASDRLASTIFALESGGGRQQ
jgi:hypothetical protein